MTLIDSISIDSSCLVPRKELKSVKNFVLYSTKSHFNLYLCSSNPINELQRITYKSYNPRAPHLRQLPFGDYIEDVSGY